MKRQFTRLLIALAFSFLSLLVPRVGAQGPTLGITNDPAAGVSVYWPTTDAAFSLQWTTGLAPTTWQPYPATPSLSGDGNSLVVPVASLQATNPMAFFQLVSNAVAVPAAPTVVTTAASPVNYTVAELTGTVLPNTLDTTWWFQWGLTTSYGNTAGSGVVVGSNTTPQAVYTGITGLSPGTTYHFQLFGSNVDGLSSGGDVTLTTPAALPDATVQTFAASNITSTSAQLNGSVNPNGSVLVGFFNWGTSTSYGNSTSNFYDSTENFQVVGESYTLTGLTPNTTYHFQIAAFNGGLNEALGNDVVFTTSTSTPQFQPPIVVTLAASSVTGTTATLNATINPNGSSTVGAFLYGNTTGYGQSPGTFPAGGGSAAQSFQTNLTGLTPNTTYNYTIEAGNSGGSSQGANVIFTTGAATQAPPAVTTLVASSIAPTGATLNGTVNPNGATTAYIYNYGTNPASLNLSTGTYNDLTGNSAISVPVPVSGLLPGTTYYFILEANNSGGTTTGATVTFTTSAAQQPPTVLTLAAGGITDAGVTLNAFVTPNGADTQAYYQYGTTTSYGSTTMSNNVGSATNQQLFQSAVGSLTPNTTYHYRIVASNSAGTSDGTDASFTTLPPPPSVTTEAVTDVNQGGGATFNASANANGVGTSVYFQYGLNTSYGSTTVATNIGFGFSAVPVATAVSGLPLFTIYHYRAVATSAGGTVYGADTSFNTQGIQ